MSDSPEPQRPAYWVIHEDDLRHLLERARGGEDVGFLMVEFYASSDISYVEPDDPNHVTGYGGPGGGLMPGDEADPV